MLCCTKISCVETTRRQNTSLSVYSLYVFTGDWLIDAPMKYALLDDFGLLFKQRAKHRAISALLKKDFVFEDTPFVLQYEVHFQEGQECGGGYIKLVSGDRSTIKLHEFHDKTPYTIMFGPDKCGSTSKVICTVLTI